MYLLPFTFVESSNFINRNKSRLALPVTIGAQQNTLLYLNQNPGPGQIDDMAAVEAEAFPSWIDMVKVQDPRSGRPFGIAAPPAGIADKLIGLLQSACGTIAIPTLPTDTALSLAGCERTLAAEAEKAHHLATALLACTAGIVGSERRTSEAIFPVGKVPLDSIEPYPRGDNVAALGTGLRH